MPEGPKARTNKTSINFMILILIFVENCLYYDAIHEFSVYLGTGFHVYRVRTFKQNMRNEKEYVEYGIKYGEAVYSAYKNDVIQYK